MFYKILIVVVPLSLLKSYECSEHKLKIEDVFMDFVNYTYIDEETFVIAIDYESESQSSLNIRIDIIKDFPEDIRMKVKVWGRAFGQYTLPTGINVDIKFCQGTLVEFIRPYMVATGMSDVCPPKKGTYENHGISTEIVGLPVSLLPDLHFLVENEIYSSKTSIMKSRAYIFVS